MEVGVNETARLPWCCGGGLSFCEASVQLGITFRFCLCGLPWLFHLHILPVTSWHRVSHFLSLVIQVSLQKLENEVCLGDSYYVTLSTTNIVKGLLCARYCLMYGGLRDYLYTLRSSLSNLGRKAGNSGEQRGEVSNPSHQKRVTPELSAEWISQPHKALGGEGLDNSLSKVGSWLTAPWAQMKISRLWDIELRFRQFAGLVPVFSPAR